MGRQEAGSLHNHFSQQAGISTRAFLFLKEYVQGQIDSWRAGAWIFSMKNHTGSVLFYMKTPFVYKQIILSLQAIGSHFGACPQMQDSEWTVSPQPCLLCSNLSLWRSPTAFLLLYMMGKINHTLPFPQCIVLGEFWPDVPKPSSFQVPNSVSSK